MKLSELLAILQGKLDLYGDLEVRVTSDRIIYSLYDEMIYRAKNGSLYIDADGAWYKDHFAVDPHEGEWRMADLLNWFRKS